MRTGALALSLQRLLPSCHSPFESTFKLQAISSKHLSATIVSLKARMNGRAFSAVLPWFPLPLRIPMHSVPCNTGHERLLYPVLEPSCSTQGALLVAPEPRYPILCGKYGPPLGSFIPSLLQRHSSHGLSPWWLTTSPYHQVGAVALQSSIPYPTVIPLL